MAAVILGILMSHSTSVDNPLLEFASKDVSVRQFGIVNAQIGTLALRRFPAQRAAQDFAPDSCKSQSIYPNQAAVSGQPPTSFGLHDAARLFLGGGETGIAE